MLTAEAVESLEEAKLLHHAVQLSKILEAYYEKVENWEQLADMLKLRSSLTSRLGCPTEFSYFYVGFWGKSFPTNVQNLAFIYRGNQFERFEDFCSQLKARFPKSEILKYTKTIQDDIKEGSGMKIQVYPVKPIINGSSSIHFEHSRSFKNGKNENEISILWVERRIFTITDSFPSISNSNRIINVKSTNLKPVSHLEYPIRS